MKRISTLLLLSTALATGLSAQISFSNQTRLLTPVEHFSGVAIAIADMNGDGLDDIARLSYGTALNIQYQTVPGQAFTISNMTPLPGTSNTWGMCAADVDNDGFGDVLSGGYENGVKIARSQADGTFSIQTLNTPITFVQGVNFADINNDGWLDAFVCHDDGVARIFENKGDGTFIYQPMWIDLRTVPTSDNSGNYGSVWSDVDNDGDLDLYIAKCRQGVSNSNDPRRINQLFLNNGDFTFTQDVTNTTGLRIGAQSWTADFGDIDNDGDFDCFITNHDVNSQLLENDGAGHFTDITMDAGLIDAIKGLPLQGIFRDFDNDGFTDILVAGDRHYIFRNNGNKTFTTIENPFDANQIESYAVGDLNGDGFQDVYAGYAEVYTDPSCSTPDALWMNKGNNNHFYGLNLRGHFSNRDGVGAKVRLYSALGIQTREVRSGESYGISNSLQIQFGLGQVTQIDSVVINWPSGLIDVLYQPAVDQYMTAHEGTCAISPVSLVSDGPSVICSGQSVALATTSDFEHYQWNTGDSTATISVQTEGLYYATVTNADGCTVVSRPVKVVVDPVQTPVIHASGDTLFCEGTEIVLTSSEANSYLWNTGETTQTITVNQSGNYDVTTQGACATFYSELYAIEALDAPLPSIVPDTVEVGAAATLVATGSHLAWYSSPVDPTVLSVNDTLLTPSLTETTTYWVSNTTIHDNPNKLVGMQNHQGDINSDNSYNGGLIFDCYKPFILAKTKVYAAVAGERKIELLNSIGDVLQSKVVNIPSGTSVIDLNFDVPVGASLYLSTNEAFNQNSLGTKGPKMRRSNQGCDFPYQISDVVRIKESSDGCGKYYYFYNWEVDFYAHVCESERVPVTAVVEEQSSVPNLPSWASGLRVFPNPTHGVIHLDVQGFAGGELLAQIKNAQGQTLQTRRFSAAAGNAAFSMNLGSFPAGIYWLEIAGDGGVAQRKVALR